MNLDSENGGRSIVKSKNPIMTMPEFTHSTMNNNPSGPSSKLIARVHHLHHLLENLPSKLPLNPVETTYYFGLDSEHVDDEGIWYAFNCNLEVCFETHKIPSGGVIVFREQGARYKTLIEMIKVTLKMLSDNERTFLCDAWLERLISAVELQGAKVLPKCIKPECSFNSNDLPG